MPIKKDGTGKRWVEMEFAAPGTPEQVWEAMATGPGNTAWFTKATVDGRIGGQIELDFGPVGKQGGEVTAWEPPHRFAYVERDWSPGAPPIATEITITARSGDRCIVRMVHSLFSSSEEWDDQMEGFENGWPGFFAVLRLYLGHFPGQRAASFVAMTSVDGDHPAVWKRFAEAFNIAGADVGDRCTTPPQLGELTAVVERIDQDRQQRYVVMRLDPPTPGAALVGTYGSGLQTIVSMTIFYYGDDAEARAGASEPRWREWIGARLGGEAGQSA
jgi:uncharacterized protein YndB with AHSA1/START domain